MTQQPAPAHPRPPWTAIVGLLVAGLGALLMVLQLGALVVIVGVFALAGDESLFAALLAVLWIVVAVVVVLAMVALARRGRAWARIVLAALAIAAGAYAIAIQQIPAGPVLVVLGLVLLSLPTARRWLAMRATTPRAVQAPVAPPVVGER